MTMTADELRAKMASLSGDELREVLAAREGEYLPNAREAAAFELDLRAGGGERVGNGHEISTSGGGHEVSYFVEDGLWRCAASVRDRWRNITTAWRRLPGDGLPDRLCALFWIGVSLVISCAGFVASDLRHSSIVDVSTVIQVATQNLYALALGAIGAALAYGIRTERNYPRWLAVGVVVLLSGEALVEHLRLRIFSTELFALPVATWASVQYLLSSTEIDDYYYRVRNGMSRRLSDLRAGSQIGD